MNLLELSEEYSTAAAGVQSRLLSLREEVAALCGDDEQVMRRRIAALQDELRDMNIVINGLRAYYLS